LKHKYNQNAVAEKSAVNLTKFGRNQPDRSRLIRLCFNFIQL